MRGAVANVNGVIARALRGLATQIKTGSLCRSDRVSNYSRLLFIEDELGADAVYCWREAFRVSIG